MLRIETSGTWREMGRHYGEALREEIARCIEQFAPWLLSEPQRHAAAIADLRATLEANCPELCEETQGMAEGARLSGDVMLGYRFFHEVRLRAREECSVVFLAATPDGPLLGRNCDLSPGFEAQVQLCHLRRPTGGPACALTTYVGMAGGVGVNERGFSIAGASAGTDAVYGDAGVPGAALCHMLLHRCGSVAEARGLLADLPFLGKPMNLIAADETGASVLLECAPGRVAEQVLRAAGSDWQACTNFFLSGAIPLRADAPYLSNAYARFGRITHRLSGEGLPRSVEGVQELLTDIAQPGLVCPAETSPFRTAYSQVMELSSRTMHLCPGHPEEEEWERVGV